MLKNWFNKNKSHLKEQIGAKAKQAKSEMDNVYIETPERQKVFRKGESYMKQAEDAYNNGNLELTKIKLALVCDLITQEFDKL